MNKNLMEILGKEKIYPIIRSKNEQEVIDTSAPAGKPKKHHKKKH